MLTEYISHPDEVPGYRALLQAAKVVALWVQSSSSDPHLGRIQSVAIAAETLPTLHLKAVDSFLQEVLASQAVKVFYNAKQSLQFFMQKLPSPIFDAMLADQLLDKPGQPKSFTQLTQQYLGEEATSVVQSASLLLQLRKRMVPMLVKEGFARVAEIEFQCARALAHVEYHGIYLNQARWQALHDKTLAQREAASHAIQPYIQQVQGSLWEEDAPLSNLSSPQQLLAILRQNGIDVTSTRRRRLEPYRANPLVQAVQQYRQADKAITSFLQPFVGLIHPVTGRLHPQYEQCGVVSGRMSCGHPNIQQVPRDNAFRQCFTGEPGRVLIVADYSQIELRVAAQIAQDERMLAAYQKGEDLHLLTASYIAGKPMMLVSKQERQAYKAVNLGLIYGMGAKGLQKTAQFSYGVDMSLEDATYFRKRFFETYHGIAAWHEDVKKRPQIEARTLTGRRVYFSAEAGVPERLNLPVQGSAADIIKKALAILVDRLQGTDTWIVGVVHDEILLEAPRERAEAMAGILKLTMEEAANVILPDVPTTVEATVSESWEK